MKANAEGLQKTLSNAGYNAQIAYNEAKNMYRVVASTYDDKAAAVQSRNTLRGTYPDAWLLLSNDRFRIIYSLYDTRERISFAPVCRIEKSVLIIKNYLFLYRRLFRLFSLILQPIWEGF